MPSIRGYVQHTRLAVWSLPLFGEASRVCFGGDLTEGLRQVHLGRALLPGAPTPAPASTARLLHLSPILQRGAITITSAVAIVITTEGHPSHRLPWFTWGIHRVIMASYPVSIGHGYGPIGGVGAITEGSGEELPHPPELDTGAGQRGGEGRGAGKHGKQHGKVPAYKARSPGGKGVMIRTMYPP